MDFEKRLTEIAGAANVKLEEPMKNHTTFRIGGPARYFVTPENADTDPGDRSLPWRRETICGDR